MTLGYSTVHQTWRPKSYAAPVTESPVVTIKPTILQAAKIWEIRSPRMHRLPDPSNIPAHHFRANNYHSACPATVEGYSG